MWVHSEQSPSLSLSRTSLSVAENGSASYTVKLDTWPVGGDVTVAVGGTSGTDVTVDTDPGRAGDQSTLTFRAAKHTWWRPQTVTVRASDDTDTVWDRVTLTHTASGANYGSVTKNLSVVVDDDDGDTPIIEFARSAIDTAEGEMAVIQVRNFGGGAATVDYATADGSSVYPATAAAGRYTPASGTLTFASGETEKTITAAIGDDGIVDTDRDRDRDFTITLSNPSGAVLGQKTATVRIKRPDFEFTSANYYVREDQGPAVITVRKIGPGPGGVEYLTIAKGHPFAEPPGDRPIVEDTLIFAADETEKTFTVPIVDDGVPEPDEVFGVALRTPPHRGQLGKNRAFVTIRNWPPAPVIKYESEHTDVQENEGTARIKILKVGGATSQTVTVDYRTLVLPDAFADTPSDYTSTSGTLTFAPSETEKTITIPIIDDDTDEPNEIFVISLEGVTGAIFDPETLIFRNNTLPGFVSLIDDDPPPVIGFAHTVHTVHEGDGTATVTVTKTGATARTVKVNYATADATATAPADYTDTSGTLSFAPSETEKIITVPLAVDSTTEDPETFSVTLSNPVNATLGTSLTYLLMEDGDAPMRQVLLTPTELTISASPASSVTEGGDVTFTVTSAPAPQLDLVVNVGHNEEMGAGLGYVGQGETTTVTIPAGRISASWTVTTMSDDVVRADGTVVGRILPKDGWYTLGSPSSVSLALLDDDGTQQSMQGAQDGTVVPEAPVVPPALIAGVRDLAGQTRHGPVHVKRWKRVLVAFGVESYPGLTATTAAEARANAKKYSSPLWPQIAEVLAKLEAAPVEPEAPVTPEITLSGGGAVTEGTDATFILTASPAPAAVLSVSVAVATDGEYGVSAGSQTVTLDTTGSATLALPTTDDAQDEPDGSVTMTLNDGEGYTVGTPSSGTVAVQDDDLPPPVISILADAASVSEGGDAAFTLTADRAPDADLTVQLTVTETGDGDHVGADREGATGVTLAKGATSAAFTVATVDDAQDEPDGSVTVTLNDGEGYMVGSAASGTVAVRDNDVAVTTLPTLSVDDVTAKEGTDWLVTFTVRLSAPSAQVVEVRGDTRASDPLSAEERHDYWPVERKVLRFDPGDTERQVRVLVYDDSHDEEAETFELVLSEAKGATIGDGVAVGTITNDDPMPAAWLARFGRTVAEQALDGIAGRMAAPRTPGLQGTVAGQAFSSFATPVDDRTAAEAVHGTPAVLDTPRSGTGTHALADVVQALSAQSGPSGHSFDGDLGPLSGADSVQTYTMTAREALLGSSFSLMGEADGAGGSLALWGRAAQGSFDGREGAFSLDGEATTAMLGADYARGGWLAGLALIRSDGDGDYADTGPADRSDSQACDPDPEHCREAVRAGDGRVEATLAAAIPYASLQVSERLKVWGATGYGTGEVRLKTALGGRYKADTEWYMAAAGLRGDLLEAPVEGSGPALALTSDALWTRTSSEKTHALASSDSDVTRLRLGLEGSYHLALAGGGSLVPKIELGVRDDGDDAETGSGLELGVGLRWQDPRRGLVLEVSGRTLITHDNDDLEDRGFAASLDFDPDPQSGRGLSLSLRQELGGQAEGGLDALFAPAVLEERTGTESSARWNLEAAYGLPALDGRFTASPHAGFALAADTRDYSLGWRLAPEAASAPEVSFDLQDTRTESDTTEPEHTLGVGITARW